MTQLGNGDLVVVDYYNLNNNGFGALYRFPVEPARRHAALRQSRIPTTIRRSTRRSKRASPTRSRCRSRRTACTRSRRSPTASDEAAPGRRRRRAGGQVHPSVGGAGERPARRLDARAGERPQPPDDRCRTTTAGSTCMSRRRRDRRARASSCCSRTIPPTTRPGRAPWCRTPPCTASTSRSSCPGCRTTATLHAELPGRHAARPGRQLEPLQARELPRLRAVVERLLRRPRRLQHRRERAERQLVLRRAPTPASTRTPTSGRSASSRWRPNTHRSLRPARGQALLRATPASGCGSWARSRCARPTRRRHADARPGGQSGHQLPGEDPGRHAVHLPDPRPRRAGAQHGADLAPGAAGRGAARTAAAATRTASSRSPSRARRRRCPATAVYDLAATTPLLTRDAGGNPGADRAAAAGGRRRVLPRHPADPAAQLRLLPHRHEPDATGQPGPRRPRALRRAAGRLQAAGGRRGAAVGLSAGHRQRHLAADQRQPLHPRASRAGAASSTWKIFGQRLDGWTNADHPTESVPGDAATLPPGDESHGGRPRLHRHDHAARRAAARRRSPKTRR